MDDNRASHLVGDELHHGDAVEEKISLSDRFGLWLGLHPFNQNVYLQACCHWVSQLGTPGDWDASARAEAVRYATLRGGRSGRVAFQFANQWIGTRRLAADA
jgi:hypothetical protein